LKELIKLKPDFSPAIITLAYIKYTKLELDEAVRLASKVINQGPGNVDLSNFVRAYLIYGGTKGLIAHRGGPLSKVINGTVVLSYLKKAQSLQPDSAGVLLGMGSFYLLAPTFAGGDLEKAQDYLGKAIAADPLSADAYARIAQLYMFKGDNQKYGEYLNKAQEIDPKSELTLDIKSGECKFVCSR
jgi:tetratricopeptide (TPR) repeat protein